MISILNEHFLIISALIILCFGIIYRFATYLNFPSISYAINTLTILALVSSLFIIGVDISIMSIQFNSIFIKDHTTVLVEIITILIGIGVIATTNRYNQKEKITHFEYIILLIFVLISIQLLITTEELFSFYLILEFQSICFYILASLKKNKYSIEASIKYFIIGSFASIILLLGFSFLYGVSGLTKFEDLSIFFMSNYNNSDISTLVTYGLVLTTIGLLFKVYMVPMHLWVSDIYANSPNSSLLIFATSSLLPFFFIVFKIYVHVLGEYEYIWKYLISITCIASIVIGTIGAMYQYSIKRLLAYSSIANTGYIFLAFLFYDSPFLLASGLLYLVLYTINTFGLISVITNIRFRDEQQQETTLENIYQLQGLYEHDNFVSAHLLVYFYAIAGLPPFSFFFSKIVVFTSLLYKTQFIWLIILMACLTVISVFYYVRIVQLMYFNKTQKHITVQTLPFAVRVVTVFIMLLNFTFVIMHTEITSVLQYVSLQLYL